MEMKPIPQHGSIDAIGSGEIIYDELKHPEPISINSAIARKRRVEMFRKKLGTKKPNKIRRRRR